MDEITSILVPANGIAEIVAAAEADHLGTMDGIDEALEMITTGITLEAVDTIGAGREATVEIVVEVAVADDVIVPEIARGIDLVIVPGIDHAAGQGIDRDLAVGQWIDLANDQRTRVVIAREIDPVIGLLRETDLGIDRIDLATVATGMVGMEEVPVLNAAEVPAQLILAKIAVRERLLMAELQKKAMAKIVTRPTGAGNREIRILEGGAVEVEAVEEAGREERRVVMPVAEVALLVLLTAARGSKG